MFYRLNQAEQETVLKFADVCDLTGADDKLKVLTGYDSRTAKNDILHDVIAEIVAIHNPDPTDEDDVRCVGRATMVFLDLAAKYIKHYDRLPTEVAGDFYLMVNATYGDNLYWVGLLEQNLGSINKIFDFIPDRICGISTEMFKAIVDTAFTFYMHGD